MVALKLTFRLQSDYASVVILQSKVLHAAGGRNIVNATLDITGLYDNGVSNITIRATSKLKLSLYNRVTK